MSEQTAILFVPGSFAPSTIYRNVEDLLAKRGYRAVTVQLPSTVKRFPLPPATLQDDVDVIKRAAETLIGLGRKVVVVCHSYGGTPTTQALAGVPVKRIIYLTAVVPSIGQNQIDALEINEGFLPPTTEGYMHMDALAFAGAVINDLPWETAYPLTLQMMHHSRASFEGRVTQLAYNNVPITYILCTKDLIISPEKQREMIDRIEETGTRVSVEMLESGHCPNWSRPEELVAIIAKNAEL